MHPLVPTKEDIPAVVVGTALSALCALPLLLATVGQAPPVAGQHPPGRPVTTPPAVVHQQTTPPPTRTGGTVVTVSRRNQPASQPSPSAMPTPTPSGSSTVPVPQVTVQVSPTCLTAVAAHVCLPALALGG